MSPQKLENLTSEVEFWEWYDKEIKNESQLVDDQRTFLQAIIEVKRDFWDRPSRTKRKREKTNPSDQSSWYRTYGCFYKHLPKYRTVNLADIQEAIGQQKRGTRNYKYVVSAMKKLARMVKRQDIVNALEDVNTIQTENANLQTVTLQAFVEWRERMMNLIATRNKIRNANNCKAWLWVFSMQVVYGLRISEVFAIKNLFEPYVTKDGVSIPPLNDLENSDSLIYVGEKTIIGTTVKTGSRIARPNIPPKYPNLVERFDIKNPLIPSNRPRSKKAKSMSDFFNGSARKKLLNWSAPVTQTHALRHLANINGMQAGIPLEIRAQSMGHTPAMNDSVYKKRQGTQTTIDLLLNSNQNAIDFVTALSQAKKLVKENESDKEIIAKVLSIIYQKRQDEIISLL